MSSANSKSGCGTLPPRDQQTQPTASKGPEPDPDGDDDGADEAAFGASDSADGDFPSEVPS